jgi:LmbE family N-acetylglucosaminyl deacetylase
MIHHLFICTLRKKSDFRFLFYYFYLHLQSMNITSVFNRVALFFFLSCFFSLATIAQAPKSYTSSEILLQLKKLNTVGAVLYIAAHPDDENTRLISYLANEKCLRTGYLSLTRGDGGQNLIGPEQGIELGVIRTQELLAARRIDGGEQFFTRAYDFGYSKSPEETFRKWNKDSILSDMVWVIRNFRPDIIITRFATDGSGGHGHHTASAILAEEAFDAAADPTRFPEQLKYVSVWKTRRMFHNSTARFFNPNADLSHLIKLDVGGYNPLLGKNYGEIAAESRSMHKSQGFGSAKQRGEQFEYFKPIKGDTSGLKDIFEGMDFSWKRVKGSEKIGGMIDQIIQNYAIEHPEKSSAAFQQVHAALGKQTGKEFISSVALANSILLNLNGIFIDANSSESNITLGSKQTVSYNIINRKGSNVQLESVQLPGSMMNHANSFDTTLHQTLNQNEFKTIPFQSTYGKSGLTSQPYYLRNPIKNNMFDINPNDLHRGAPEVFVNSGITAQLSIDNIPLHTDSRIQYRWVDHEKGELYRPMVITPPIMINVNENVVVANGLQPKQISVTVRAGRDSVESNFFMQAPEGWRVSYMKPSDADKSSVMLVGLKLGKKGSEQTLTFLLTPTTTAQDGKVQFFAQVDGENYTKGIKEIKYDHIPVQTLFPEAEAKLVKLDIVKKSKRIGYIPGAGDGVAACLSQLGYEVVTLTDDMLAKENLSQFDAIISGVRAYNTNEKLPQFKQRLMDYVSAGGNYIVQYNTNSWAGPLNSELGPYPFKITRDRITDEEAAVTFELPNHPIFNTPNKITEKDFDGWIQERSIYHASEWDSKYEAPISMADPNEKANKGALIIAKHGKGHFVYTGLVFFRELPAGVPGAYRLFVNLIELGK